MREGHQRERERARWRAHEGAPLEVERVALAERNVALLGPLVALLVSKDRDPLRYNHHKRVERYVSDYFRRMVWLGRWRERTDDGRALSLMERHAVLRDDRTLRRSVVSQSRAPLHQCIISPYHVLRLSIGMIDAVDREGREREHKLEARTRGRTGLSQIRLVRVHR